MYSENTIQVINYGREDCSNLHSWGPGIRQNYILHYVIRGSGYLDYGTNPALLCSSDGGIGSEFETSLDSKTNLSCKTRIPIGTYQAFLTYPDTIISYYPEPSNPWEYTWVDFVGKNLPKLLKHTGFSLKTPVTPVIPPATILPIFEGFQEIDIFYREKGRANGLLLTILGICADLFPSLSSPIRSQDERLSTALLLVQSNYHKVDFHVDSLCDRMHLSRSTLYRIFQRELGCSPIHYLLNYRLSQAAKLLEKRFSVKDTAYSCGFSDPFYFSKLYKAKFGQPPSAYTKNCLLEKD